MDDKTLKPLTNQLSIGFANHKIICDENGKPCDYEFVEINPACEEIIGLKAENVIGKKVSEILPNVIESDFDWVGTYGDVALNNTAKEFEQYSTPLKKYFHVKVFSLEKNYFITLFSDITEKKQKDEEIEQSNIKFKQYIENAPYAIFEFNTKGLIIEVNSEASKMTGYLNKELLSMNILDLIADEDKEEVIKNFKPLKENKFNLFKYSFITKTKETRLGNCRAVKIESNRYVAFAIDFTEQGNLERERNQAQKKYKALFDNMRSGAAIYEVLNDGKFGRDYIVKNFNKESLRIEGKTKEEVIGKSVYDLRPNIDEYGLINTFREVWKSGISQKFQTKIYIDDNYNNYYENDVLNYPTAQ
mgnify:CR=1 FL=1|jgi:PAS domain S-box-containing protein